MAISERIQENPLYLLFEFQVSDYVVFGLLQREIYLKVIIENWHFLPIFWAHESSFFSPLEISSLVFFLSARSCMFPFRYLLICLFVFSSSFWWGDFSNQKALKMGFVWFNRVRVLFEVNFCILLLSKHSISWSIPERNSNIVIISFWNKFDESVIWQGCYGP